MKRIGAVLLVLCLGILAIATPGRAQEPPADAAALATAIAGMGLPFEAPVGPPLPPPAPVEPIADPAQAVPAVPVERPRDEPGLQPITLSGWMSIIELTPTLGDEVSANGRLFVVFEHQIGNIPPGWRLGYRAYGAYTSPNGAGCDDCYLAEGTIGNIRGYISGRATITWTSMPDRNARYSSVTVCVTAINPETNEIRLSNLCETKKQGQ